MIKIIITFIFIFLIFSCKEKKQQYPKFVHNKCNNKWAVITGNGVINDYNCYPKNGTLYLGIRKNYYSYLFISDNDTIIHHGDDTIGNVGIGDEIQFSDSISAVKSYNRYIFLCQMRDSSAKAKRKREEREQLIKDSIYKCEHTYE